VVFPLIRKYLDSFFTSLENQGVRDFDLYIVNNGLEDFNAYKLKYKKLNIREINFSGTPSEIRIFGIEQIKKENYDVIIFGDADDYFAQNRVEKIIELIKDCDILVNDFNVVDDDGRIVKNDYLSQRLENRQLIDIGFIKNKNIFGLTNTAVRMDVIDRGVFDKDSIAFDWLFFNRLLSKGCKAIFTNETITYYRQHRFNTVGIGHGMNPKDFLRGIQVKSLHYQRMSDIDPAYSSLYQKFNSLYNRMGADNIYLNSHLEKIKALKIENPLWWEEIKLPEETKDENKINK